MIEKTSYKIPYFNIEGIPGGNQDWFPDFWMKLGGCAALSACDQAICLAANCGMEGCCTFSCDELTRKNYVDFGMVMKPYISPRMMGVTRLSIFTEGFGDYLKDRGYEASFVTLDGHEDYEKAVCFIKEALHKKLPVSYLMLRHKDKELADLNWHWFTITGYRDGEETISLFYHTYGEELEIDFPRLWNTGMNHRGGMVAIDRIRKK